MRNRQQGLHSRHQARLLVLRKPDDRQDHDERYLRGIIALAVMFTILAFHVSLVPSLPMLLYAGLAIGAEALVVPPAYAGWPNHLYAILTVMLLDTGPGFIVPTVLLALVVRAARRITVQSERWPLYLLAVEASTCLIATTSAVWVAQKASSAWQGSAWYGVLGAARFGTPGLLLTSLAWMVTVAIVMIALGVLSAMRHGYTWPDIVVAARIRHGLGRAVVTAVVVYIVLALCMAFVPSTLSAFVVATGIGLDVLILWWQARKRQHRMGILTNLAELAESKDAVTGTHLLSVARRTTEIAQVLGLTGATVDAFANGALLHDVGKLTVSCATLTKPGKLDATEWDEMRAHTTTGRAFLRLLPGFATAALIAGAHHERWDGMGYPDRLSAQHIPLAARIVAVADTFDAMTADRPYHQGVSPDEAMAEIQRGRGTQFDPQVVDACQRALFGRQRPPLWCFFSLIED